MDFQKEYDELMKVIEELNTAIKTSQQEQQGPLNIESLEKMLGRTQEIMDKLNTQANEIAEKMGISREDFKKYMDNPSLFGKEEAGVMQQIQEQVDSFQSAVSKTLSTMEQPVPSTDEPKKYKSVPRGNWMPM